MSDNGELSAFDRFLIASLSAQFKRAALVHAYGHEDEDRKMESAGSQAMRRTAMALDGKPGLRVPALEPLLDDPDWNVREAAAACLVYHLPERALAVLQDVDKNGPHKASIRAMFSLLAHERGGLWWINGLEKPAAGTNDAVA